MKKLLVVLMLFAMVGVSWGAGASTSCDNGTELKAAGVGVDASYNPRMWLYTCSFVADDATAAFTSGTVTLQGYLLKVTSKPGGTAPAAATDGTLTGPYGGDVMGTAMTNKISTNGDIYPFAEDGTSKVYAPVYGSYTLAISGNTTNSAAVTIYIYVQR